MEVRPTVDDLSQDVQLNVPCPEPGCTKILQQNAALQFHLKQVHGIQANLTKPRSKDGSRFFCPIENCKYNSYKSFAYWNYLKQHYMKVHAEKKYQCPFCPAKFSLERLLRQHRAKGCCNVLLQCSICQCKFTAISGLQRHYKEAHNIEAVRAHTEKTTSKLSQSTKPQRTTLEPYRSTSSSHPVLEPPPDFTNHAYSTSSSTNQRVMHHVPNVPNPPIYNQMPTQQHPITLQQANNRPQNPPINIIVMKPVPQMNIIPINQAPGMLMNVKLAANRVRNIAPKNLPEQSENNANDKQIQCRVSPEVYTNTGIQTVHPYPKQRSRTMSTNTDSSMQKGSALKKRAFAGTQTWSRSDKSSGVKSVPKLKSCQSSHTQTSRRLSKKRRKEVVAKDTTSSQMQTDLAGLIPADLEADYIAKLSMGTEPMDQDYLDEFVAGSISTQTLDSFLLSTSQNGILGMNDALKPDDSYSNGGKTMVTRETTQTDALLLSETLDCIQSSKVTQESIGTDSLSLKDIIESRNNMATASTTTHESIGTDSLSLNNIIESRNNMATASTTMYESVGTDSLSLNNIIESRNNMATASTTMHASIGTDSLSLNNAESRSNMENASMITCESTGTDPLSLSDFFTSSRHIMDDMQHMETQTMDDMFEQILNNMETQTNNDVLPELSLTNIQTQTMLDADTMATVEDLMELDLTNVETQTSSQDSASMQTTSSETTHTQTLLPSLDQSHMCTQTVWDDLETYLEGPIG